MMEVCDMLSVNEKSKTKAHSKLLKSMKKGMLNIPNKLSNCC